MDACTYPLTEGWVTSVDTDKAVILIGTDGVQVRATCGRILEEVQATAPVPLTAAPDG